MNKPQLPQWLLSAVFAAAVACFFGLIYPHHLHYQEQFQLFLFDGAYAREVLSVPGGVADYAGRFLTQFFLYAWLGAVLLAVLVTVVQGVMAHRTGWSWCYALTFLPAGLLWRALLDESLLPGAVVAVLLCQLLALAVGAVRSHGLRCGVALVLLPLAYWAAGPIALWLYTGLVGIALVTQQRRAATWATLAGLVLLSLALPSVVRPWLSYGLDKLTTGVHYFRLADHDATWLWAAVAGILVVEVAARLDAHRRQAAHHPSPKGWHIVAASAVSLALVGAGITGGVNAQSEEVMAYDFMARMQQWNRILLKGEAKAPNSITSATVHNLALALRGRLADHAFEYPQRGTEGLLPLFVRDPFSPLATSEVYYQLGMINTAQRHVFEAQEAIPDYQKSGRCYKRLAETNLINGAYDVAAKYLHTLQKTWFYRQWATETLALLGDEEAIARHKEYGRLRQMNIRAEFFYSDRDLPQMLGQLLLSNRQNRLAFEYLEMVNLLRGDLDAFARCYGLSQTLDYPAIPTMFQQGLLTWWSRDHAASEQIPAGLRPDLVSQMHQFYADVQSKRFTADQMRQRWGKTYWYYYFYERQG